MENGAIALGANAPFSILFSNAQYISKALSWSKWFVLVSKQTLTIALRKESYKVRGARIRNQYNQVPHLTQDNNGKVTNSQLDTTNDSQKVSPFS